MVVVLSFEQRHHVRGHFHVRDVQSERSLHRCKLKSQNKVKVIEVLRFQTTVVFFWGSTCYYLGQLFRYPNLTVWLVIDLEPGCLNSTPSMATRNNPLTSRPIEIHLRFQI